MVDRASTTAVAANEDIVPAGELRAAQQRICKLERLVGENATEVEVIQAARDGVNREPHWYPGCPASRDNRLGVGFNVARLRPGA